MKRLFSPLLVCLLLAACSTPGKSGLTLDQAPAAPPGEGLADSRSGGGAIAGKAAPAEAPPKDEPAPEAKPDAEDRDENETPADDGKQAKQKADDPAQTSGLYIIRSATLTMQVKSVHDAQQQIAGFVKSHQGFITDSKLDTADGGLPTATLTIRVPATRFDDLLGTLGGVGTVASRQVTGEDVTLDYVDTSSRVRNLQREEAQLLALLKRAGKLSDVLQVERELSRVRGEIEQSQGRLRHLANQVDLATITVTLSEKVEVASTSPWQLGPAFQNAWNDAQRELAGALSNAMTVAIAFVVATLPLLILGLGLFLLLGFLLRLLLVNGIKVLSGRAFNQVWLAAGVVFLLCCYPGLAAFAIGTAVVLGLGWAGMGLSRKLFRRRSVD